MSTVAVYSYAHSTSYVTDNILKSFKDVLVQSGLDPQKLAGDHKILHAGIKRWIETEHLEFVTLEIYHPKTEVLITRWDITVAYSWSSEAGNFWVDADALRYACWRRFKSDQACRLNFDQGPAPGFLMPGCG